MISVNHLEIFRSQQMISKDIISHFAISLSNNSCQDTHFVGEMMKFGNLEIHCL